MQLDHIYRGEGGGKGWLYTAMLYKTAQGFLYSYFQTIFLLFRMFDNSVKTTGFQILCIIQKCGFAVMLSNDG